MKAIEAKRPQAPATGAGFGEAGPQAPATGAGFGEAGPPSPAAGAGPGEAGPAPKTARPVDSPDAGPNLKAVDAPMLKEAFLSEIRKAKKFFYGTVVAQAQRIDFETGRVVFVFGPQHRALRVQLEQNRPWLEAAATQLAGRNMAVTAAEGTSAAAPGSPGAAGAAGEAASSAPSPAGPDRQQSLKDRALSDTGVQTMLDVFAAEIKDVEEL